MDRNKARIVGVVGVAASVVALTLTATATAPSPAPLAEPVLTCVKPSGNITHAHQVAYEECLSKRYEALLANLHPVPTVTETKTETETVFTSSPSPTTTSPTPTPTQTPTAGACVKPDATNTGATGTLTAYNGPLSITTAGTLIEDKTITGDVIVRANNVTIRNSKVTGSVWVQNATGARFIKLTTPSFGVSSAQDVVLDRSDLGFVNNGDAMHVTSDSGSKVTDVKITNNYVHDPRPPAGAHFDGLQVRGADRLEIYCNNFDLGAPTWEHNASVYLEPANGGHSAVVVDNNWLFGGAFGFMYGRANDNATRLTNNHFGGEYLWQSETDDAACYGSAVPAVQFGNDLRGVPFTPCP